MMTRLDAAALLGQSTADGLLALGNAMTAITAAALEHADPTLTAQQLRVMTLVAPYGAKVCDISRELAVQSSTATRTCDRLVYKGWVQRQERPTDRRVTWIVLTTTGRTIMDAALAYRHDAITAMVEAVTPRLTPELPALLHAIAAAARTLQTGHHP